MIRYAFPDLYQSNWIDLTSVDQFLNRPIEELGEVLWDSITPIVFDLAHEGMFMPHIARAYELLELWKVPAHEAVFITSAIDGKELNQQVCDRLHIQRPMEVRVIVSWALELRRKYPRATYVRGPKPHPYLCLNRILRPHRAALLGLLSGHDVIDTALYSYRLDSYENPNAQRDVLSFCESRLSAETFTNVKRGLDKIAPYLPITFDDVDITTPSETYYRKSYFSVITETHFFPYYTNGFAYLHERLLTEKIFKPIAMKHPFVVLGPAGTLSALHDLGYKSYSPLINEEYDTIQDHDKRLVAVSDEVCRLTNLSHEDWQINEREFTDLVNHNYSLFMRKALPQDYLIT